MLVASAQASAPPGRWGLGGRSHVPPLPRALLASLGARRPLTRSCLRRALPCPPSRCSGLFGLARLSLLVRRPRSRPDGLRPRRALAPWRRGALAWSLSLPALAGRTSAPRRYPASTPMVFHGANITKDTQKTKAK